MWLSWRIALTAAVVLVAVAVLADRLVTRHAGRLGGGHGGRRGGGHGSGWRAGAAFARETALVLILFSIWQVAAELALTRVAGAVTHGVAVWDAERALHLPSEVTVQQAVLPHPLLVQAANGYYAIVHVPALIIFLIWLFARHRTRYAGVRNTLALLTAACLLIQMVPVAPPRLIPTLGVTDAGALYHQSVYGPVGAGVADQLSAMPSVHVAWAGLIAVAAVRVGAGPWRWLVVAHPVLTLLVVVVTGNHFWLDGLAALGLLALAAGIVATTVALVRAARSGADAAPRRIQRDLLTRAVNGAGAAGGRVKDEGVPEHLDLQHIGTV